MKKLKKAKSSRNLTFVVLFVMGLIVAVMLMFIGLLDLNQQNEKLTSNLKDRNSQLAAANADLKKQKSDIKTANSRIKEMDGRITKQNFRIKDLEGQVDNLRIRTYDLDKENTQLFIDNLLLRSDKDKLTEKCNSLDERSKKLANFLRGYISANAPETRTRKFDLDTLAKVLADLQENLSIISGEFALVQKEADSKEGWNDSDYQDILKKSLAINSKVAMLRNNLYKYGLMHVRVYNLYGCYEKLKKEMESVKKPATKDYDRWMKQSLELNKQLFGNIKVCN